MGSEKPMLRRTIMAGAVALAGLSNAAGIQMPDLDYIFWQRSGEPAADA